MTTGLLTTIVGRNAIIADLGGGTDLVLTHVAWGDANGVPYNPNEAQVALVNERYRATIASVAVVAGAIVVDAVIPADTSDGSGRPSHGFSVAEVGLFNNAGVLIGVARCGNGYKPPPSSGQAHDVTYRLKLAVANPSAISVTVDPQAQIAIGRLVRPGWITVDGVLNAPPASPALRATYIIGAAPTGAWSGFAHRIAQWVGVWSLCEVPFGHHAVDNSKGINAGARWLERTASGWSAGVSRLIQKQPGNYAVAGGTANALTVTLDPSAESYASIVGMPLRLFCAYENTGPVTLAETGLTPLPVLTQRGSPLSRGDIPANSYLDVICGGTSWRAMGVAYSEVRRRLISDWVVWVRGDGADGNDGSSNTAGGAFRTLSGAWAAVRGVDTSGYKIHIRIGLAGDYEGFFLSPGPSDVQITGIGNTVSVVCPPGLPYCLLSQVQNLTLKNLQLKHTYTGPAMSVEAMVWAFAGSNVTLDGCLYWATSVRGNLSDIYIAATGSVIQTGTVYLVGTGRRAHVRGSGRYNNSDGVNTVIYNTGGVIPMSDGFCAMDSGGIASWPLANFSGAAATGRRYHASYGGQIHVYGAGVNFLPGDTAGITPSNGFYG